MLSTKGLNYNDLLTEKILSKITDEDIFRKYVPFHFNINSIYNSPLRNDDDCPSFGIYYNPHYNKLMFKDYRDKGGDCFTFVKELFNITYKDALQKICQDFDLDCKSSQVIQFNSTITTKNIQERSFKVKYQITTSPFDDFDLSYWNSYGISIDTLKKYNVFRVSKLFMNNYLYRKSLPNIPIYAYYFPRTNNIKVYSPFASKKEKWRNNANNTLDIQGYDQLPSEGKLCIFTKSMKDVMTLYELGYTACATHSENEYINPDFFRHLSKRFEKLVLLFDNDIQGKTYTEKLHKTHNLPYIFIPEESGVKDISDYYKKYGRDETISMLKKLLND